MHTGKVKNNKVCKDCFVAKPRSEFYSHRKKPRGTLYYAAYCKECSGVRSRTGDRKRRDASFLRLWDWFAEHPCVDCGETNPLALELDHVRGTKVNAIANMMDHAWHKIEAELAKCETRCGNCHKIKTAASLGHFATESLRTKLLSWPANQKAFYVYEKEE